MAKIEIPTFLTRLFRFGDFFTALNLSPQILSLGDSLITKITGFTEEEDNFGICHDFLVSNLLYHTYLEPHESDALRKFEKLIDKWKIQNKGEKKPSN